MQRLNHATVALSAAVMIVSGLLTPLKAQEQEDGAFSEGFGVEQENDTGDTDASSGGEAGNGGESGEAGGFDSGFGSFGSSGRGDGASPLTWGGRLRFDARGIADYDAPLESPVGAAADAQLELSYEADNSEALIRLDIDEGIGSGQASEAAEEELLRELMDEAYLRLYYDTFNVQAGFIKTVWGQGDEVHVVDLLNSNDLEDFINPDYIDRRLAAGMLKLNVPWSTGPGRSGLIELAYLPVLRPDYLPEDGRWAPAEARIAERVVSGYGQALAFAEAQADGEASIDAETQLWAQSVAEQAIVSEATDRLRFGQIGLRATARLGGVDIGAVYYAGYNKTPTPRIRLADPEPTPGDPTSYRPDASGEFRLEYDPLQAFGLETATVVGPFNLRAEAAYYLTEDVAGDDPEVPNNSLNYLLGFDTDLGISNLNVNVQGNGTYILESDLIDAAGPITEVSDGYLTAAEQAALNPAVPALPTDGLNVLYYDPSARYNYQYDEDGIYTSHIVSIALTDSWDNDRIRPELTGAFGVERLDWWVAPAIEFVLRDDTLFAISSGVYGGDEAGFLGQFDQNDYLQLRFEYNF